MYDTFDRCVSTKVTDYTTNGSGVAVAGTPVVETYAYDEGAQSRGDVLLDFVDSDGSGGNAPAVSKRYLWGQAVDQLFAQEDVAGKLLADSDRYLWLLQDKLGTVRDVLDRSGGIVARVEYNAFGVIQSVTNAAGQTIALPTRWLYTCQEYDPVTGNIWFSNGQGRGRWYSPTLNRFLQPDELGFAAGDMNLYRYVGNSPTNYTDPSGREEEEGWSAWAWNNTFGRFYPREDAEDDGAAAGYYGNDGEIKDGKSFRERQADTADAASSNRDFNPEAARPRVSPEAANCMERMATFGANHYGSGPGRVTPRPGTGAMGRAAGEAADTVASGADNAAGGIAKRADGATDNVASNATKRIDGPCDDIKTRGSVDYPTTKGDYPSWSAVQQRYWGAEGAPRAEIRIRKPDGSVSDLVVSKELHHTNGRTGANPHRLENLEELWPWEHAAKDPNRRLGYEVIEIRWMDVR